MEKKDFKKELKHLYAASAKEVVQVDVPAMHFLMVDGQGDPNTAPSFAQAVEALFSVSYTLKFLVKKGPLALDYGVMPLEGLWWADDMKDFGLRDKSNWKWTAMVMQPACITQALVDQAVAEVRKKKDLPALDKLRFEAFTEGPCAQTLHIGPFSAEGPTIEKVHQFIAARGRLRGKHHEIYLSDTRRAAPEKWKTIVRQPMQ
ncbi:hypothetical protein DIC66_17865 [Rhodoferax lacus]|jgi:hypothetical protein|uniref:GyrI-like small molecule binding domain-containing protein n=1 Tax=Rhodoferax lacus TaxID=2184758 RepID=A0A3E1R7Z4_9BURK|nr:GyrI-like domain-containing protein [Rhodoferax lacus]RFO95495.1 hypothetical protein DIC66_17865 [Rhodoferax lacus]